MPQRTIAPGGGNWNSTATWVEGAVPTSSDFVVGNASSGQLTINVGANAQYVDFSAYTQTLTMNSFLQLGLANATNILGAGMSFAGTFAFNFYNVNGTLIQNTTNRIPFLSTANTSKTYSGNIYCVNLTHQNAQVSTGGNVYISGNYANNGDSGGTTKFIMDGTGTFGSTGIATETIINTTGTITISPGGFVLGRQATANANDNPIFRHQAGTIVNPRIKSSLNGGALNFHTIDLISGNTWNITLFTVIGTRAIPSVVNFSGTANFDNFIVATNNASNLGESGFRLNGVNITTNNFQILNNMNTAANIQGISDCTLYTDNIQTITVNNQFVSNGGLNYGGGAQNPNTEIRSFTSGTTSNFIINTYNQYVSSTTFTDISCSGGNTLYGQNLTLTRTSNITQYTLPISSGGASYTFIS